jgi:hypothetical protein
MAIAERQPRDQMILNALARELERQGIDTQAMDLIAVAEAVDRALGPERRYTLENEEDGLAPDELSSANDV